MSTKVNLALFLLMMGTVLPYIAYVLEQPVVFVLSHAVITFAVFFVFTSYLEPYVTCELSAKGLVETITEELPTQIMLFGGFMSYFAMFLYSGPYVLIGVGSGVIVICSGMSMGARRASGP